MTVIVFWNIQISTNIIAGEV